MGRARKHRVRVTLTLDREANKLLREHSRATGVELSMIASHAIVEWVKTARAVKWQSENGLD